MANRKANRNDLIRATVGAAAFLYFFLAVFDAVYGVMRDWVCVLNTLCLLPVSLVCGKFFVEGPPKPPREDFEL